MTQPWLKVYPERMLGDAKLSHLTSAEHWWLIVCLHIAANAEPYGELRLSSGRAYDAPALARFLREPVKKVDAFLSTLLDTGVARQTDDEAVTFPNLERLQGSSDPTALVRKRRQRDRDNDRDSHVTEDRDSHAGPPRAGVSARRAHAEQTAESREQKDLSRNHSSKPTATDPAEHNGFDQHAGNPQLPHDLARILDPAITKTLKPGQVQLVAAAWDACTELRESIADVEGAVNPTGMLVSIAHRILPDYSPAAEIAETSSRRAAALAACRRMYQTYLDAGETPARAREFVEQDYHHDPSIVTEAITTPTPSREDVAL